MELEPGDVKVTRWTRYGKDRLYFVDGEGRRLGWADLLTGAVSGDPRHAATLSAAAIGYCAAADVVAPPSWVEAAPQPASHPAATQAPPPIEPPYVAAPGRGTAPAPIATAAVHHDAVAPLAPSPPTAPTWHDLADNRPGQGVRAMAEAELAAMKDRSRVGTFLARALDVKTDERAWRVGADGEEAIGARLEKLRPHGWRVLHSVPVGSGSCDIDHVLIGPGGVWTINTKKHPDGEVAVSGQQVRVNGHRTAYVPKARAEAERAGKLLSLAVGTDVEVRAALVFLTGTLFPNVTIGRRASTCWTA